MPLVYRKHGKLAGGAPPEQPAGRPERRAAGPGWPAQL
jgi:hypothetical protein